MTPKEFNDRVLYLNREFANLKIKMANNKDIDFTTSFEILYSSGFELMEELGTDINNVSLLMRNSLLKISNEILTYTSKEFQEAQEVEMNKRITRINENKDKKPAKRTIGFSMEK